MRPVVSKPVISILENFAWVKEKKTEKSKCVTKHVIILRLKLYLLKLLRRQCYKNNHPSRNKFRFFQSFRWLHVKFNRMEIMCFGITHFVWDLFCSNCGLCTIQSVHCLFFIIINIFFVYLREYSYPVNFNI